MTVTAKFKCETITLNEQGATIGMRPVYGNGDPNHENTRFFSFTPSGKIEMGIVKGEAAKEFAPGREYYVRFEAVE